MKYSILKSYKYIDLIKLDEPILGGLYGIVNNKDKKAKTGLTMDAAFDLFVDIKMYAKL